MDVGFYLGISGQMELSTALLFYLHNVKNWVPIRHLRKLNELNLDEVSGCNAEQLPLPCFSQGTTNTKTQYKFT